MKISSLKGVQGTDFLFLNRDYLDLIFVPFFQQNVRFTPILFLLTFPLGTDFCQKTASPVLFTKLNSLLPLHLWLTKLHLFTADDFPLTSQSRSWPLAPDDLTVFTEAGSFAFQTAFAQNFFASFIINFLTSLCLELQWKLKKMVTKLDHLLPSKKYSKLTCEVQPHCVLLWNVQTWFFNTKL